ncbi:hypothetical protein D2V93_18535 [Flagellimonas taeanensis]|nr:hypothetical protein D2V93_18535 [Allomuricauda taeanensis]
MLEHGTEKIDFGDSVTGSFIMLVILKNTECFQNPIQNGIIGLLDLHQDVSSSFFQRKKY